MINTSETMEKKRNFMIKKFFYLLGFDIFIYQMK